MLREVYLKRSSLIYFPLKIIFYFNKILCTNCNLLTNLTSLTQCGKEWYTSMQIHNKIHKICIKTIVKIEAVNITNYSTLKSNPYGALSAAL